VRRFGRSESRAAALGMSSKSVRGGPARKHLKMAHKELTQWYRLAAQDLPPGDVSVK